MNQNRKRRVAPPVAVCIAKKVEKESERCSHETSTCENRRKEGAWLDAACGASGRRETEYSKFGYNMILLGRQVHYCDMFTIYERSFRDAKTS